MRVWRTVALCAVLLGCSGGSSSGRGDIDAQPANGATSAGLDAAGEGSRRDDAGDSATQADAPPPTPIPDDASATRKLIFLTSTLFNANLGGLAGADMKCQAAAAAANVSGVYKAWLGDLTTNAEDRLSHASVPYELVDGTLIASDWAALLTPGDAGLAHPIDETELGKPAPQQPVTDDCAPTAWTGGRVGSQPNDFGQCAGWTSDQDIDGGLGGASLGCTDRTNGGWRYCCYTYQCSLLAPLYCLEQ